MLRALLGLVVGAAVAFAAVYAGQLLGGLFGNRIADALWPVMPVAVMLVGAFAATLTVTSHPFWMMAAGMVLPIAAGLTVAASVGRGALKDD